MNYDDGAPFEVARYRHMQKALPGVETLYTLMLAQIETALPTGGNVMVVGAGGGREVEALLGSSFDYVITGVDPSAEMLAITRWFAKKSGHEDRLKLVQGLTETVAPPETGFDAATSILVMHFLPDDNTSNGKLAFLKSVRERLTSGALLVHADVSFDTYPDEIEGVFLNHARLAGLSEDDAAVGPKTIATMPIIGTTRLTELFDEAGFSQPTLFYQALWYRAWIAKAV
ncbi:MAG: class I SAM-dependent methyltransferase [Pseudomonadota bacterium]